MHRTHASKLRLSPHPSWTQRRKPQNNRSKLFQRWVEGQTAFVLISKMEDSLSLFCLVTVELWHVDPCMSVLCMTTLQWRFSRRLSASILKRGHEEITAYLTFFFSIFMPESTVITRVRGCYTTVLTFFGSDLYGFIGTKFPRKTEACSAVTGTFGWLGLQESQWVFMTLEIIGKRRIWLEQGQTWKAFLFTW